MKNLTQEGFEVKDFLVVDQEVFLEGVREYLQGFVKWMFERAIQKELTEFLGRQPYERGKGYGNYRNGYYERDLITRYGVLEDIRVARDRNGEFETKLINRYKRKEKKIDRLIGDIFIGGISTRGMKRITKTLLGKGYSAGTISRINKELTEEMKQWLNSPIEDDIVYLFMDGLNLPVRRFAVSKESLLMVIGVNKQGKRRVLGVQLGDRESASSWGAFFADLKARGLKGKELKLGIMDGLPGLESAFEMAFPKAKIQRCIVHKLWNIGAKLPRSIQADCLAQCKRIFSAHSKEEALERFNEWKQNWERIAPSAVECFEKDIEVALSFYSFPKAHWKRIRTTNIIERAFKEFRRRTRQMDSFPNEECCLRCVFMIARNLNENWGKRRHMRFPMEEQGREAA